VENHIQGGSLHEGQHQPQLLLQ
jgi:hypothetical protein